MMSMMSCLCLLCSRHDLLLFTILSDHFATMSCFGQCASFSSVFSRVFKRVRKPFSTLKKKLGKKAKKASPHVTSVNTDNSSSHQDEKSSESVIPTPVDLVPSESLASVTELAKDPNENAPESTSVSSGEPCSDQTGMSSVSPDITEVSESPSISPSTLKKCFGENPNQTSPEDTIVNSENTDSDEDGSSSETSSISTTSSDSFPSEHHIFESKLPCDPNGNELQKASVDSLNPYLDSDWISLLLDNIDSSSIDPVMINNLIEEILLERERTQQNPTDHNKTPPSTSSVCKFSNGFNNCWLNSALQAALNVNIVQEKLLPLSRNDLERISRTPLCAKMFLQALHNPGHHFKKSVIRPVLKELSRFNPELKFKQQNDVADFVQPFLGWLNLCGIETSLQINCTKTCDQCTYTTNTKHQSDDVFFVAQHSDQSVSLTSLFNEAVEDLCGNTKCEMCSADVKRQISFGESDLITLYLPRHVDMDMHRREVTPESSIDIPVNGKNQKYRLASVICHERLTEECAHFYAYIAKEDVLIQASDTEILLSPYGGMDDIASDGTIFLYERCTETTD